MEIKDHSEELSEVLGTPPRWLVRWGTMIAWLAFAVIIGLAYFVKYPDIIEAPVVISYPNPPVAIVAKKTSALEAILIKDDVNVEAGQLLAVYESSANLLDIDTLEKDLSQFKGEISNNDLENFTPRRNLQLGNIQEEYADFIRNFDEFVYGALSQNDQKSIARQQSQIRSIRSSIDFEKNKLPDVVERDTIAQRELRRLRRNYSKDVDKYGELYRQMITRSRSIKKEYTDIATLVKSKELEIQNLQKQIKEIQQQTGISNSTLQLTINENINRLKAQITAWKSEHLIEAPISGRAIFYQEFDNENQTVKADDKILRIIPPGEVGQIYGKVDLSHYGSGKVEEGQAVIIKLDNFPYHEFGMIDGVVKNKADVPQENNTYKLEVDLINGLKTSTGRKLDFSAGMNGTAEIITKDRRVISRVFENVFD